MRLWMVSYDIADDTRRRRAAAVLHTQLERVQDSVFEGWLKAAEARLLLAQTQAVLDARCDQLRAWPLAMRTPQRQRVHGAQQAVASTPDHWMV